MPQQTKPARLWRMPSTGIWYIRYEGRRRFSTHTRNRREAEGALARFIAERHRPIGPNTPDKMTVAQALEFYCEHHAPTVKDPVRIAHAVDALVPLLGPLPLSSVNGASCRFYAKQRKRAPSTVRKELGTLAAAINYCHTEGYLTAPVKVKLPPKTPPRDRWLTRREAARLLRAAYRNPKGRHLARFILIALYTGTRTGAILGLQFMPNTQGGHVDTARGIMHRRGIGVAETKKRTPPIPVPRALLAHLRRWERDGSRFVVHVRGNPCGHVNSAWTAALKASGIEHCTKHDLRHTSITWALQAGMDRWAASGFFGVSLDVLERVYGHHDPRHMRRALEALELRKSPRSHSRGRSSIR